MSGVDLIRIGELGQALQRVEQALGAFARIDGEVGARRVADEERVAGEDKAPVDDERAVLRPVARGVQHAQLDRSGVERFPILERVEGELGLGERVHGHRDAVLEREPPVAGDVVGVRMRLEDADDAQALGAGGFEVLLDRICGVDHDSLTPGGIPDQIGGAAEIVVDELAKQHEREANTASR